ncbi:MAG: hypothetical protein RLZ56_177 [Bacteroidota bacterium]
MIPEIRKQYNLAFTESKYQQMIADIEQNWMGSIDFRLAETPIFLDQQFKAQLLAAGDSINAFITGPNFKALTENALKQVQTPPNEQGLPACIVMDFAICKDNTGKAIPKLIELQGFPSLFGFEYQHDLAFRKNFEIPNGYSPYLNNFDGETYLSFLSKTIKGTNSKHTVLLELFPNKQKTKIDFYITQHLLDIPVVCLTEVFVRGNQLYYHRDGKDFQIERVYNRIVWDELGKQNQNIQEKGKLLLKPLDIEWVTHPNHYYRISKFLLPLLSSPYVPKAYFLSALSTMPNPLSNYVLKPLFSFAGQGVIIDVQQADIDRIKDPENWILQEKVNYAPVIETPTGAAKTEIRLFYFLDTLTQKYIATLNLSRISKGKMIGVSYNANATWVGGSIAYFESNE